MDLSGYAATALKSERATADRPRLWRKPKSDRLFGSEARPDPKRLRFLVICSLADLWPCRARASRSPDSANCAHRVLLL